MIETVLPVFPTPPSSNDKENFRTRSDAFLALFPEFTEKANTFISEANTLQENVNNSEQIATEARSVVEGLSNYKGDWVQKAYGIGESVSYGGYRYISKADNNEDVPGSSSQWERISFISTVASNALMGDISLQYTVDYGEATETTTRDYVVGDLVSDGTNKVVVECIANSTAGALLTDTTYFTVKGTNGLVFSNAVFTYTNGKDNNGYVVTTEKLNDGIYVPSSTANGLQWLYKVKGNVMPYLTKFQPMNSLYNKEFADDNRLVFNTSDGKLWTTKGGELGTGYDDDTNWTPREDANDITITSGTNYVQVDNNSADYGGADFTITTEAGVEYIAKGVFTTNATSWADVRLKNGANNVIFDSIRLVNTSSSFELTFTADADTAIVEIFLDNDSADFYGKLENLTIYKKQATLDAPLETPVSFLSNPVFYSNGVPQYIDKSKSLASVVVDTLEVSDITLKTVNGQHPAMLGIGGEGYSWTNVLDDRTDGVTYTNDTGKPIMVSILLIAAGNNGGDPTGGSIEINGDDYLLLQLRNDNGDYVTGNLTFMALPNDTYELTLYTNGSISRWFELR